MFSRRLLNGIIFTRKFSNQGICQFSQAILRAPKKAYFNFNEIVRSFFMTDCSSEQRGRKSTIV